MLNSVRLKTCVVDGSRDAKTVDAESAAFVDREAGNLKMVDQHLEPIILLMALHTWPQLLLHNRR